jgi:hypothetical protein
LPLQRWIAHPPPTGTIRATPKPRPPANDLYNGPPSYRGGHPRWGFPPVVWKAEPDAPAPEPADNPAGALRSASWLSGLTAVAALVAAGAEIWRFVLLLEGRTQVLSGGVVRGSDALVAASGSAVVLFALLTAAVAVPALVRTHAAAARRLGRAPSRSSGAVIARLLVPGWNVYGAGQIATEIDGMLTAGDTDGPPRRSWITPLWWLSWFAGAVLMIVTLARGFGGSLQAIADTVELHIALDLVAAVVAGLGLLMLRRFAGLLTSQRPEYENWVVQPPSSNRPIQGASSSAGS